MDDFRFSINDAVAHVENLGQKMLVKEIKRRTVMQSTGEIDEVTKQFKKIPKNKIDGIVVYWFEGDEGHKVSKEQKFHSELLVPFTIAQQGKEAVEEWQQQKLKQKTK
jgi:hypothetical protein